MIDVISEVLQFPSFYLKKACDSPTAISGDDQLSFNDSNLSSILCDNCIIRLPIVQNLWWTRQLIIAGGITKPVTPRESILSICLLAITSTMESQSVNRIDKTAEGWNTPKSIFNRWLSLKVHRWARILILFTTIWCLQCKRCWLWWFQWR